jgi:hypothetical protein
MFARLRQRLRAFLGRPLPHELVSAVVLPVVAQRAILLGVVYFASFLVGEEHACWRALPRVPFFDIWLRGDSYYYLLIATHGYNSDWGIASTFFPLYPWLVRLLSHVMPAGAAALLVAHLATVVGLCLLYLVVRRLHDAALAQRTVWVALLFPTSFFFSAGYSESTYLAMATGAFLAWQSRRQLTAIGLAAAATLTHPVGAFCFSISFTVGWLVRRSWKDLPVIAAGPALGLGIYAFTHYLGGARGLASSVPGLKDLFGEPARYRRSPAVWWRVLLDQGQSSTSMLRLLNWSAIGLAGVAGVDLLRRRQIELALITWISLAVPLAVEHSLLDAFGMMRFALLAFPLLFVLARWAGEGNRARVLGLAGAVLQVVLAVCFTTWRWAE